MENDIYIIGLIAFGALFCGILLALEAIFERGSQPEQSKGSAMIPEEKDRKEPQMLKVTINIELDKKVYSWLRRKSRRDDTNVSELIRIAIAITYPETHSSD